MPEGLSKNQRNQEYETPHAGAYISETFIAHAPVTEGVNTLREYFYANLKTKC
jgi:hypothetical protein